MNHTTAAEQHLSNLVAELGCCLEGIGEDTTRWEWSTTKSEAEEILFSVSTIRSTPHFHVDPDAECISLTLRHGWNGSTIHKDSVDPDTYSWLLLVLIHHAEKEAAGKRHHLTSMILKNGLALLDWDER